MISVTCRRPFSELGDQQLLEQTRRLAANQRCIEVHILDHLDEIDRRGLALRRGFSSLFDYAVRELRFTDAAAQRRIQAMRLCRRHGWVRASLQSGELSMTSAAQLETTFAGAERAERQCHTGRRNVGQGRCHDQEKDDDPSGRTEQLGLPAARSEAGERGERGPRSAPRRTERRISRGSGARDPRFCPQLPPIPATAPHSRGCPAPRLATRRRTLLLSRSALRAPLHLFPSAADRPPAAGRPGRWPGAGQSRVVVLCSSPHAPRPRAGYAAGAPDVAPPPRCCHAARLRRPTARRWPGRHTLRSAARRACIFAATSSDPGRSLSTRSCKASWSHFNACRFRRSHPAGRPEGCDSILCTLMQHQTLAGRCRRARARRCRGLTSTNSCRFRRSHPAGRPEPALDIRPWPVAVDALVQGVVVVSLQRIRAASGVRTRPDGRSRRLTSLGERGTTSAGCR